MNLVVPLLTVPLGSATTVAVCLAMASSTGDAAMLAGLLLGGPAWAYAHCLASEDEDFAGAGAPREWWCRVLPWTFLLAPLVLPNLLLLLGYARDGRADGGHTMLGSGRTRPGDW